MVRWINNDGFKKHDTTDHIFMLVIYIFHSFNVNIKLLPLISITAISQGSDPRNMKQMHPIHRITSSLKGQTDEKLNFYG